jgi:L-ascorbate metabolism protein UlaG (beta-lactamase superfamily)
MNPEEALDAFEMMGGKLLIPMHHDTFPLGGEPLDEPVQRLIRAANSRSIENQIRILEQGESHLHPRLGTLF